MLSAISLYHFSTIMIDLKKVYINIWLTSFVSMFDYSNVECRAFKKNEYAEIHKYAIYNHKRHVNIVYCWYV